jgi:RNA 3'-terminal phosphate cyclase-like protein
MATIRFEGERDFRQRVICCVLAGRPFRIDGIRADSDKPGVHEHEASLLRLLTKITNGTRVEISPTGTTLKVKPGILSGGSISHECAGSNRGIGYFLEFLLAVAPFSKHPLDATLTGFTNTDDDTSVDIIRTVTLKTLSGLLGNPPGMELKVTRRGVPPGGGGLVNLKVPIVQKTTAVQWTDFAKIKRIRGIAWSTKVSPALAARVIESAKGELLPHTQNVYIYGDHYKGPEAGASPGYGVCLVAESTTGAVLAAQCQGSPSEGPEACGKLCATRLLREVAEGGCVDSAHQWLVCLYMALAPEDVSKVRLGALSPHAARWLRTIRQVFGVKFKIQRESVVVRVPKQDDDDGYDNDEDEDEEKQVEEETVLLTCVGSGYINMARQTK